MQDLGESTTGVNGRQRPKSATLVHEAESYTRSVAGATVEAVRLGRGIWPNVVIGVPGEDVTVTASAIGFPMFTSAEIAGDSLLVAFVRETDGESRWCGVPIRSGAVRVYGPGAEHFGHNQPGLRFEFAITSLEVFWQMSDALGVPARAPSPGEAADYSPAPATMDFGAALGLYAKSALDGSDVVDLSDDLVAKMVRLLGSDGRPRSIENGKAIDSREIVRLCIDYAESIGRIPSIPELCRAAHVSERRLRSAFTEEFDVPPSRFFKAWALDEARRRLRAAEQDNCSVTQVETELGFGHLGRFAGAYGQTFGESPSQTLSEPARRLL